MIHLPSSDDGEKVLIYILFYMMKTNSIEFFYNNIFERTRVNWRTNSRFNYRASPLPAVPHLSLLSVPHLSLSLTCL